MDNKELADLSIQLTDLRSSGKLNFEEIETVNDAILCVEKLKELVEFGVVDIYHMIKTSQISK